MKKYFLILMLSFFCQFSLAQKDNQHLRTKLESLVKLFHGDVGIYVRHLKTGQTISINADSLFPTASMIKIPITIGVFNRIEKGELQYHADMTYRDSLLYEGVDLLGSFKDGEKIALDKVLMLMATMSDNTASLWAQSLAGTGTEINQWLSENGFSKTRVNSRTGGREGDRQKYGWGQTTPKEMAELMVKIREGKVISERASERIYRNLARTYWDSDALSQIPPYIHVASKQGAVDQTRGEVLLVNAPHGDYVFCIITKNQTDQSWTKLNEGSVLIRNISALLWKYFEPTNDWSPPRGIEEWW
jgi:beta-lactamase class A